MTVYIYALTDPDGTPRYVGQSVDPERRYREHRNDGVREIRDWFAELGRRGAAPGLRIIAQCEPREADFVERALISEVAGRNHTFNAPPGYRECDVFQGNGGQCLLDQFLIQMRMSQAELAKKLGVTKVAVHHWRTGRLRPAQSHREAIESISGGAIPAGSWGPLRDPRGKPSAHVTRFEESNV